VREGSVPSDLNRTVTTTATGANTLDRPRSAQELQADAQAQTQITQAFAPAAANAIGSYADRQQAAAQAEAASPRRAGDEPRARELDATAARWAEGGVYRVAMHTGLGALAGGSSGAVGAGLAATAAPALDELQSAISRELVASGVSQPQANAIAAGVVNLATASTGAALGAAPAFGAMALNVDANNRQLHPTQTRAIRDRASQMAGRDGLTAEQWEARLTREALRLNDASFAHVYEADPQAQAVLAQIESGGGPRMDWRNSAEYGNAAINAQYLAQLAPSYSSAGPMQGRNPGIDPLTYAYAQAAYDPGFASLPPEQQRQVLGQLIIYGESLQTDPRATPIQRAMADAATRNAAAQARDSGAVEPTLRTPADQRMGQGSMEQFIGAAIAGRPSTARSGAQGDTPRGDAPPSANADRHVPRGDEDLPNPYERQVQRQETPEQVWQQLNGRVDQTRRELDSAVGPPKQPGNVGVAEIQIDGQPAVVSRAHSQIGNDAQTTRDGFVSLPPEGERILQPQNRAGSTIDRSQDTEYKILENFAQQNRGNTAVSGRIDLFTERPPCRSCTNVIERQFQDLFPNMIVHVYHSNGQVTTYQNGVPTTVNIPSQNPGNWPRMPAGR
jgi:filamentous hemagglutinin